jgi:hypothetical protein
MERLRLDATGKHELAQFHRRGHHLVNQPLLDCGSDCGSLAFLPQRFLYSLFK